MAMVDPRDIFRRFSPQAKQILTTSQEIAESAKTGIGSEHLLIALASIPQTLANEVLKEYAISLEQIRLVLSINNLWNKTANGLTDEAKDVLKAALRLAASHEQDQIEPEHLLLAIVSTRHARAYQIIARVGIDPNHLKQQLEGMIEDADDLQVIVDQGTAIEVLSEKDDEQPEKDEDFIHEHNHPGFEEGIIPPQFRTNESDKKKILEQYAIDLTEQARNQQLDPVVERDTEILRTIQILARRTKNNPILIGEPGVGKTAIVEGLAQRIASNQIPPILHNKKILRLDLAMLVAGTMYRGQFEERLKKLLDEVAENPNIILFVDEIHTVVGTGSAEGSLDAANIIKPAMARGKLRLIGATTLEDYRKFIEKDAALERRFQNVIVNEPNIQETIKILEGLKTAYEKHHKVEIQDDAIQAAAVLSKRYISDRFLPDKAIDLLDEAAAAKQISEPNKLRQAIQKTTQKIEQLTKQKERAIEREAFTQATKFREKEFELKTKLTDLEQQENQAVLAKISKEDIAGIIAQLTGVPRGHLIQEANSVLTDLEDRLNQQLIGQPEAVAAVAATIRRAQARLNQGNRPLGTFLLLGPSGVGKTELARLLAKEVFGSSDAFVKLDMSEFMERHTASRLVGAPPGYVGYEEAGKLTEAVRRRPYSLILLDEIEKAHRDVQNLLLQVMEDGVLTDAKGRRVNFANTIIILTSNLGSQLLTQAQALGFEIHKTSESEQEANYTQLSSRVMEQVKEFFQPEFLNRLDSVQIFKPLSDNTIRRIVDLRLAELASHITEEGYIITFDEKARDQIAKHGFDPQYGARPIRRLITTWIEDPLAELIVNRKIKKGKSIKVLPDKNKVKLVVE